MARTKRIIQLRREGYRIWKIAELTGRSTDDVVEVLVDAGIIAISLVEAFIARESKPRTARKFVQPQRSLS